MKWFNDSKIMLLLLVFVGLTLAAGSANADFTFGEPVNLESVIPVLDPAYDAIDCFSCDGLEMFIDSNRPGGYGDFDICVLRRDSQDAEWGPPENLGPMVNSPSQESFSSISADGLTLYFGSNRPGGYGYFDIYMITRATKNDPWGAAVNMGPNINSSATDGEPWPSPDGLEFYFESYRAGGYGHADIYVAKRATINDTWGVPVNLGSVVNGAYWEQWLSLSPDGLLLLFSDHPSASSFRPGGYGNADMWMTRRASISDPWQLPVNLGPKVNSSAHDGSPRLSLDGRTLYFWTARSGSWENYQAPIIPIVDFNGDEIVDFKDFSRLAQYWGQNELSVDIGPMAWGDGRVDIQDLAVFAENWLFDFSLIAHWKLDETEGTIAHDSISNKNGNLNGGPIWQPAGGKINGALQFDGTDDYVSTPFVLNPATGAFSVFVWTKGGAPGQVIISQTNGAIWLGLGVDSSAGKLLTRLKDATPWIPALVSDFVITDGDWHRVGFVWDGARRHLYADSEEVVVDSSNLGKLVTSDGGLYIGAGPSLSGTSFWSGLIDDVRIYNRAVNGD